MNLRSLIVALMLVLAGCVVTPSRAPVITAPVLISQSTWQQVDEDIVAASHAATEQAKIYARGSMEHWRTRVYERTEESFIPWFTSYWTQEWLSIKVTWYSLSAEQQKASSAQRLTDYLQEQYRDRVLAPVAVEIDPDAIMEQATAFYVQLLDKQLQIIAQRYGVPQAQLDQRLKKIPAIALAPPPARSASLYQLIHAQPITTLPAYAALADRIRNAPGGMGTGAAGAGIASVAKHTSDKHESQLAGRGVAGAAAAVAGRVAGLFISLGVAGVRAITQENERPVEEGQLRQNLSAAFDQAWKELVKNPNTGVMAGVHYLSGQIEGSLANPVQPPISPEPIRRAVPQSAG